MYLSSTSSQILYASHLRSCAPQLLLEMATKKKVKIASTNVSVTQDATPDFMVWLWREVLQEVLGRPKIKKINQLLRIPHGFYENEMEAFFKQFGTIKRLRIARNRKTGKSKHFGFIEFVSPEVAKVVEEKNACITI